MSSYVFKIATQEPDKFLAAVSDSFGSDSRIARQVAEQMPKPKPAEPTGDFLVVVAGQWPPFRKVGELPWTNDDGYMFDTWADFTGYFPRAEFVIYRPEAAASAMVADSGRVANLLSNTLFHCFDGEEFGLSAKHATAVANALLAAQIFRPGPVEPAGIYGSGADR